MYISYVLYTRAIGKGLQEAVAYRRQQRIAPPGLELKDLSTLAPHGARELGAFRAERIRL